MVRFLMDWARASGWKAIEARTQEDIPLFYAISGSAGKTFWRKLGFSVANVWTDPSLLQDTAFAGALRDSVQEAGVDPNLAANTYTMRLDL